jgi:hypothetical protein
LPTSTQAQRQFEEEERAYWQNRDALMERYAGKWVAVVGGQVVASGDQMNKVAAEAWRKTGSGVMYVSLVGQEDVVLRVRRAQDRYDSSYAPPILPSRNGTRLNSVKRSYSRGLPPSHAARSFIEFCPAAAS